jgi:hypothetical protein
LKDNGNLLFSCGFGPKIRISVSDRKHDCGLQNRHTSAQRVTHPVPLAIRAIDRTNIPKIASQNNPPQWDRASIPASARADSPE